MAKHEMRIRYTFGGTYMVAAGNREEVKRMVEGDYDLALGGSIHTIRDDDEVTDWNFGIRPKSRIFSIKETGRKARAKYIAMNFNNRIEELRNGIIEAIRQLLQIHSLAELTFTNRENDPIWIIWFEKNGDPYECRVTGVRIIEGSLTVIAEGKESGDEVECYGPLELGAKNIDWLHEVHDAAWRQLEETKDVRPKTEEP